MYGNMFFNNLKGVRISNSDSIKTPSIKKSVVLYVTYDGLIKPFSYSCRLLLAMEMS